MQFRNEFKLPSSDLDYEIDCPSEENFLDEEEKSPETVDVDMLSRKLDNTSEIITELETDDLETLQSNNQSFPNGLAPLEELFDFNNVAKKPKLEPVENKVEECNIGSELKLK